MTFLPVNTSFHCRPFPMPKTRKDALLALCAKIGGEQGRELLARVEQADRTGLLGKYFDQELSEEEFAASVRAMEKTLAISREWAQWPPVATWDQRN